VVGRDSPTFPQALFVALRRAGWPVSPVLEGRVTVNGRGTRLIGIEPLSLPQGAGPAPDIGQSDLQAFLTPPGRTLVAAERWPISACAKAMRRGSMLRRCCRRYRCSAASRRACWWWTSAWRSAC